MINCSFVETTRDAAAPRSGLLGQVIYGGHAQRGAVLEQLQGIPSLRLPMDRAKAEGFTEIWRVDGTVHEGGDEELLYAHDGEFLFCAGIIPPAPRYADATRELYLRAFDLVDCLGYPTLFRIWNFIGGINADNADGLENYRDFCRGRAEAFEAGQSRLHGMPAATGIGMAGAGAAFYLLACRSGAAAHIENSRQVPAWQYPTQYGPRPPSFARASTLQGSSDQASRMLFVSGTASILGHETVHPGDIDGQCRVAINNIAHLISRENLALHGVPTAHALRELDFIKVYYRHGRDLASIRAACCHAFRPDAQIRYIETDICRADLLVEIEALVPTAPRAE